MIRPTAIVECSLAFYCLLVDMTGLNHIPHPREACLELVAAEAEVISLCRIKHLDLPDPNRATGATLTLQVVQELKGSGPGEISLTWPRKSRSSIIFPPYLRQLPVKEVLLFLGREAPEDHDPVMTTEGLYVTDCILLLDDDRCCVAGRNSQSACWSLRLVRLTTRAEVLRTVREALAFRTDAPPPGLIELYTPAWSYDHDSELPNTTRSMVFPVDDRLERLAREWVRADDVAVQSFGLQALAAFDPSEESINALKGFLTHPYYKIEQTSLGKREWYHPLRWLHGPEIVETVRWYPLREDSQIVLNNWGVEVPPTIIREPTERSRLPNAAWITALFTGGALVAGVFLLRRKFRPIR